MSSSDDTPPLAERAAVLLAMRGDRNAFRLLVDEYDRRLLYFVRRILGETEAAYDVLQAVWLAVHRQVRSLDSPEAFRVWLYRIAHNQAVSELRRKANRPLLVEEPEMIAEEEALDDDLSLENAEMVHAALASLSVEHRQVLTLRFLEDMSLQDRRRNPAPLVGHSVIGHWSLFLIGHSCRGTPRVSASTCSNKCLFVPIPSPE
jgi:RNA polymerase sigma-70 factor, ECF subfamily